MHHETRCLLPNTGSADRTARGILGVLLVAVPALWGWAPGVVALLAAFGGVQLFTAATGY